jgi:hypothetical protein
MIDALTAELGALVAGATGLPTSIDPIRPPSVPGCYVGPPSMTPDPETGGRVLVIQWEVGAVTAAVTGAWSTVARLGEQIVAAVVAHPTLGLAGARSILANAGEGGDVPGYRIDVAVLVLAGDLEPLEVAPTAPGLEALEVAPVP